MMINRRNEYFKIPNLTIPNAYSSCCNSVVNCTSNKKSVKRWQIKRYTEFLHDEDNHL